MEAKSFRAAYGVLQEHAQTLRQQKEPNIDELLSIVTESVAAYKVCKERIDAVEKALQEALSGAGDGSGLMDCGVQPGAYLPSDHCDGVGPCAGTRAAARDRLHGKFRLDGSAPHARIGGRPLGAPGAVGGAA